MKLALHILALAITIAVLCHFLLDYPAMAATNSWIFSPSTFLSAIHLAVQKNLHNFDSEKQHSISFRPMSLLSGYIAWFCAIMIILAVFRVPVADVTLLDRTLFLAHTMTCTSLIPVGAIWDLTLRLDVPKSEILLASVCSLLGAWLGAFVIPLDWQCPWQEWPIPCVIGCLAGFFCGHVAGLCFASNPTK